MLLSIDLIFIARVDGSISTHTGLIPNKAIGEVVAKQLKGDTKTSSPFLSPKTSNNKVIPLVMSFTVRAYFSENKSDNLLSS